MSFATVICCDGCGSTTARGRHDAYPGAWYRATVTQGATSKRLDLCSPLCAGRAIDVTFDPEGDGRATHPSAGGRRLELLVEG